MVALLTFQFIIKKKFKSTNQQKPVILLKGLIVSTEVLYSFENSFQLQWIHICLESLLARLMSAVIMLATSINFNSSLYNALHKNCSP